MVGANLIYCFVVLASAAALFENGRTGAGTVRDAADALRPLAGDGASILFSVGIVGSGLLAIPVLATSAAYAITELAGWSEGLSRSFGQAKAFYVVLGGAMVVGDVENLVGIPAIQALFAAAVINGLLAPDRARSNHGRGH